jgi:hypothetical protein
MIKLDLGCGLNIKNGFEGVDFFSPNAKHKINLFQFPWPWEDSSVDELKSEHFLEHIPMTYISKNNSTSEVPRYSSDQDLLCKFMDECYRILKPNSKFTIIVPSARSNRAFQDPTHRRFFVAESFYYFNKNWRQSRGLDHYLCDCDFEVYTRAIIHNHLLALEQPEQDKVVNSEWNSTIDWVATLICKK